jgi:hypothetical protein
MTALAGIPALLHARTVVWFEVRCPRWIVAIVGRGTTGDPGAGLPAAQALARPLTAFARTRTRKLTVVPRRNVVAA